MRVAALYDIHANLPALEAVLADVREARADLIVVGGDVIPGPMPRETLALLLDLDLPVRYIYGNGELAVLAQIGVENPNAVTYWGTTSGAPLPEPLREVMRCTNTEVPWHGKSLNGRSGDQSASVEDSRIGKCQKIPTGCVERHRRRGHSMEAYAYRPLPRGKARSSIGALWTGTRARELSLGQFAST